jgi:hypothetical protein
MKINPQALVAATLMAVIGTFAIMLILGAWTLLLQVWP